MKIADGGPCSWISTWTVVMGQKHATRLFQSHKEHEYLQLFCKQRCLTLIELSARRIGKTNEKMYLPAVTTCVFFHFQVGNFGGDTNRRRKIGAARGDDQGCVEEAMPLVLKYPCSSPLAALLFPNIPGPNTQSGSQ